MRTELRAKISEYFREKIAKYGANPKGAGWKDEHSQNLRFEQLLKVINDRENITLNDLGCGYGALFLYKNTSKIVSRYYGYDICEDMLVNARDLINDSKAVFINSDRMRMEADYSVASGVFNVRLDTETEVWEEFILDALLSMDEKSLRGFAFNCLTSYVDYREDHLYYGDPPIFL